VKARITDGARVHRKHAGWVSGRQESTSVSGAAATQAVAALREKEPVLGHPLVDRIQGSKVHHLKELRPGSAGRSEIRVL
jgi:hypothetical protein